MALICPILSHLYTSSDDTTNRRQLKRRALSPCYSEESCEESSKRRLRTVRRTRIRHVRPQHSFYEDAAVVGSRELTDTKELLQLTAVAAAAPTNTTQFLMGEHGSANNSPDSDWERFHSETEEFESRQFAKDYDDSGSEGGGRLIKNELIAQYLDIEKSVQMLEKQYEEWRCRLAVQAGGIRQQAGLADQIRCVLAEIEELAKENQDLAEENGRLRAENGRHVEISGSSNNSSCSSSNSSSSSSGSSSSCCESSSETDSEDEDTGADDIAVVKNSLEDVAVVLLPPLGSCDQANDSCDHGSSCDKDSSCVAPAGGDDRRDDTGYESDRSSSLSADVVAVTSSSSHLSS